VREAELVNSDEDSSIEEVESHIVTNGLQKPKVGINPRYKMQS
jgi:hypothetical protein